MTEPSDFSFSDPSAVARLDTPARQAGADTLRTLFPLADAVDRAASRGAVLRLGVPFSPLILPRDQAPRKSERVDQARSTDLAFVSAEISKNAFYAGRIHDGHWAAVAVLSAYSHAFHTMLMEVSSDRYLPAPEHVPNDEGDEMFRRAAVIVAEAERLSAGGTVCFGFNCSPLGFGELEEKTGGAQSIATKFHPQIWGWWPEPEYGQTVRSNDSYADWVPLRELGVSLQSVLLSNAHAAILGETFARAIQAAFSERKVDSPGDILRFERWSFTPRGIVAPFDCSVADAIGTPRFFSKVLKPMAIAIEKVMRNLTESFTYMNCAEMYRLLRKTEQGPLDAPNLDRLKSVPGLRPHGEIESAFQRYGWPARLLDVLLPMIKARCAPAPESANTPPWRKGFGYALALSGPAGGTRGAMRIMPVVHAGPSGVVEAHGIALDRIRRDAPLSELRRKGAQLHDLGLRLSRIST